MDWNRSFHVRGSGLLALGCGCIYGLGSGGSVRRGGSVLSWLHGSGLNLEGIRRSPSRSCMTL